MEKWKAKYPFHFPTPSTATRYLQNSLRYTNNPTATKDRAIHVVHKKCTEEMRGWRIVSFIRTPWKREASRVMKAFCSAVFVLMITCVAQGEDKFQVQVVEASGLMTVN